jgi:hypothetical protein
MILTPEQREHRRATRQERRRLNREANNEAHQKLLQRGGRYMELHGSKYIGRYVKGSKHWRDENVEWVNFRNSVLELRKKYLCLAQYGGKCVGCGETHPYRLTFDHVNDDGADERRKGVKIYPWLIRNNFPKDIIQCLCWNCQQFKRPRQEGTYFDMLHRGMVTALGGKCVTCGIDNLRLLTVDHLDGGGKQHMRTIGARRLYNEVIKHIADGKSGVYAAKCISCNSASGIIRVRYPTMKERFEKYREHLNPEDILLMERDILAAELLTAYHHDVTQERR